MDTDREEAKGDGQKGPARCLIQFVLVAVAAGLCLAFAVTNMRQSRIHGLETLAAGRMKQITRIQALYKEQHGRYAADIATLASDNLVPSYWGEVAGGYRYVIGVRPGGWFASAAPLSAEAQPIADEGSYVLTTYFYVDESGVVRSEAGRPATATSPPRPTR